MSRNFFIVLFDDKVGAYSPGKCPLLSYGERKEFSNFIRGLREAYPKIKFHRSFDCEIEKKVRNKINQDMMIKMEKTRFRQK